MSVAVFPMDDLSQGQNSLNTALTDLLAANIAQRGIEVISGQRIIDFLSENRIRHVAFLQSAEITKAQNALNADYILLGTICQRRDEPPAIGLNLNLIRSADAQIVWSNTAGVSSADYESLLALQAVSTVVDLHPYLINDVLLDFPSIFGDNSSNSLVHTDNEPLEDPDFIEIESVLFTPKYVRPGEKVKCIVKFKTMADSGSEAKVFVKVGNRLYSAVTEDGIYYQTSWVGNDKVEWPQQTAMASLSERSFQGIFTGYPTDAKYPVTLVVDRLNGSYAKEFIGYYIVDSVAPDFDLVAKGRVINKQICFSDYISLLLKWKKREPISKWDFFVLNDAEQTVFNYKGRGMVPDSFFWRGRNNKNSRVPPGDYTLGLKLFDRAGNMGVAKKKVVYYPDVPEIKIALNEDNGNGRQLVLQYNSDIPLQFWRLELWSDSNKLLKLLEGESLPAPIPMPDSGKEDPNMKIAAVLTLKDSLGRKINKRFDDLLALVNKCNLAQTTDKTDVDTNDWQEDF